MSKPELIPIASINLDHTTQMRVIKIDPTTVEEYASDMEGGAVFPPVTLFFDGETYHIGDGFHRVEAVRKIPREEILADVREGTQRQAMLHALSANSSHGKRRTQADKRYAVERVLKDPDWSKWSAREIAETCNVSHTFVNKVKRELTSGNVSTAGRKLPKSGNVSSNGSGNVSEMVLAGLPDGLLLAECERRGWEVSR